MIWSDFGVVLSAKKYGERYKIVNIFTKDHGKMPGMIFFSKQNVSIFSNVYVDFSVKTQNSLGFWRIKNEKQNWILAANKRAHLVVCQSICFVLDSVLSVALKNDCLFEFVNFFVSEFHKFSELEILNLYAFFEVVLLSNMGYGLDTKQCSICGKNEKLHYISPRTGCCASKFCLLHVDLEKLFKIPDVWEQWKQHDFSNTQKNKIIDSLNITGHFIEKNITPKQNYFRSFITELLQKG